MNISYNEEKNLEICNFMAVGLGAAAISIKTMQVSPCVENINLGFTQTFSEHSKLVCSQLSGSESVVSMKSVMLKKSIVSIKIGFVSSPTSFKV
jgi:hypothetical protein